MKWKRSPTKDNILFTMYLKQVWLYQIMQMVLYLIWWFRSTGWFITRSSLSATSTSLLGSFSTVPLALSTCRSSTVCFIIIIVIIVIVIVVVSSTVSTPSWPICKVEKIDNMCNWLLLIKRFLQSKLKIIR